MEDFECSKMNEVKKLAMEYYADEGPGACVVERMEVLINNIFIDNPDDVFGHIVNYFQQFTKPHKILKFCAWEIIDSIGQTAVQTDLYCTVLNMNKFLSTSSIAIPSVNIDPLKYEESLETERQKSVERAIELINADLSQALSCHEPTDQCHIDEILTDFFMKIKQEMDMNKAETKPDEAPAPVTDDESSPQTADQSKKKNQKSPKTKAKPVIQLPPSESPEELLPGCSAVAALSQSVCVGGAFVRDVALYDYIACLRHQQLPEGLRIPLPMVTILSSGKLAPGKLNCVKEFMVVPSPNISLKMAMKHIMKIYNHCAKSLSGKGGMGRICNDWGALCPQFDRPEQGLDLLEDAIKQLGLTPGKEFNLAINCAGHEILDYEKGRYEVSTGLLKSPEELVTFWTDLLTRYPSVIALVDPMRKQEKEHWMNLCEAVTERCYIIGDYVCHRPGLFKDETFADDFQMSAVTFRLQEMTTVTDILTCVRQLDECGINVVIGSSLGDTNDSTVTDLAVGVGAKFLLTGGPCRGERVAKLNRLLEIEADLHMKGRLLCGEEHQFCRIKVPVLPTDDPKEEGLEGNALNSPAGAKKSPSTKEQKGSPKERKKEAKDSSKEKKKPGK